MIGHLGSKASAATFSDFLYVQGISNVIEAEKDGYTIWIHSEDELEKARGLLEVFSKNPDDPKYAQHSRQAQDLRQREEQEEKAAEKRHFSRDRIFRSSKFGPGPLTMVLIVVSIVATLSRTSGWGWQFFGHFYFSDYLKGAPEIRDWEVWRLITPIFLHASLKEPLGFLHLIFNVLWLYDLGGILEPRQGTRRLLLLVIVIAAISNSAEYFLGSPRFGGMSGVVYGLLGYIWMRGKFDPNSNLFLHPQIVTMMLVWFFLCWFVIPGIANIVHTAGLGVGMIWGYLSAMISRAR